MTRKVVHPALERLGSESIRDAAALRAALVPELRGVLERGRSAAEDRLRVEKDGLACAHRLSDLMDQVVALI
jgi:[protein-PII] uridylyltransferase